MEEYSNLIFLLVVLALLGFRLVKWLWDQTGRAGRRGEWRARLPGIDEYDQTLKEAGETEMPRQASLRIQPEPREVQPGEGKQQRTEVRTGETATEIRKAPGRRPSRLFKDSDDLRRAVIWAEVLGRPVSRRVRGRRSFVHAGTP
jgi:hypothetical protein